MSDRNAPGRDDRVGEAVAWYYEQAEAGRPPDPAGFLARYFEKLRYSFGPRDRAGLYTFLEMARDAGELAHVPELRFVREAVAA